MQDRVEQLLGMINNYGDVLDEVGELENIIKIVSEKIYEANKTTVNKGGKLYRRLIIV